MWSCSSHSHRHQAPSAELIRCHGQDVYCLVGCHGNALERDACCHWHNPSVPSAGSLYDITSWRCDIFYHVLSVNKLSCHLADSSVVSTNSNWHAEKMQWFLWLTEIWYNSQQADWVNVNQQCLNQFAFIHLIALSFVLYSLFYLIFYKQSNVHIWPSVFLRGCWALCLMVQYTTR